MADALDARLSGYTLKTGNALLNLSHVPSTTLLPTKVFEQ